MVSYVQSRHPPLRQVAQMGRGTLDMAQPLPLQPKAYLALISFLRKCRQQKSQPPEAPNQDYLGMYILILAAWQVCANISDA